MQFPPNVKRLCGGKPFSFSCHPGISCFTECCRELELVLSPYDVLCLCKELQMGAADFLERFVIIEDYGEGGFPQLYLGMVDDGRGSCPFISAQGCTVYNSRPGACRAYPVGRGVTLSASGQVREMHVLVREDHCLGFTELHSHTVAEWFENQGLTEYNSINDEVLSLLQHEQIRQEKSLTRQQKDAFMLSLYKLDEFRKTVSSASFQKKYKLSDEELLTILADDLLLLRFGIRWLKNFLCEEQT